MTTHPLKCSQLKWITKLSFIKDLEQLQLSWISNESMKYCRYFGKRRQVFLIKLNINDPYPSNSKAN